MGGGTKIVQASPPPPVSAGQSAAEYAAALPTILSSQLQFQPQFDRATFESYAELAPEFARVSQDVLERFSPEQAALGEELSRQALIRSQEGLTAEEEDAFKDTFKSLVGSQVNAPIGANFIARNLLEQDLAAKQFGQNLGLSLSGKVPLTQAFQQPSQFQVGNGFGEAFGTRTAGQNAFIAGSRPLGFFDKTAQTIGNVGAITSGVGQGLGALAAFSSIELKEDVDRIEDSLEKVENLKTASFTWKENGEQDVGFIAEEVKDSMPEAATVIDGINGIKPIAIMAHLVEAVKNLSSQVKEQKALIAELKA